MNTKCPIQKIPRGMLRRRREHELDAMEKADKALELLGAFYAENIIRIMHCMQCSERENFAAMYKAVWEDEYPGGLPTEYDTVITRRAIEAFIRKAYNQK